MQEIAGLKANRYNTFTYISHRFEFDFMYVDKNTVLKISRDDMQTKRAKYQYGDIFYFYVSPLFNKNIQNDRKLIRLELSVSEHIYWKRYLRLMLL